MNSALSTEAEVRTIAKDLLITSDAVHHALRSFSDQIVAQGALSSYAILTEEYALRARANILLNEARHFVQGKFELSMEQLTSLLESTRSCLDAAEQVQEIYELTVVLSLFATSIASRRASAIQFHINELSSLTSELRAQKR